MKRRGFFGLLAGLLAAIGLGKPETPGITIDKPGLTIIGMGAGRTKDGASGDGYSDLASAVNAAKPGDTIYLLPGENCFIRQTQRPRIIFKGHA